MKTIFLDIDGTIIEHCGNLSNIVNSYPGKILPGVIEKFNEWAVNGYTIVLTTARSESMRDFTKRQLEYHAIFYDHLVMGIGHGERVIINDNKPTMSETAFGITVDRNMGIEHLKI